MITACKETTYIVKENEIIAKVKTWNGMKFFGHSSCHPDDRKYYDEEFGKKLARARAIDKMINYNCKQLDKIDNDIHENYIQQIKEAKKLQDRVKWQNEKNEKVYEELQKRLAEYE